MPQILSYPEFHQLLGPLVDVRSPSEFLQGHIPGAFNIPLFSDSERAEVGALYKLQGKESAIELGLKIVGPKLNEISSSIKKLLKGNLPHSPIIKLYCWRGGMRSGSIAWLLELLGVKVITLKGGYKQYRQYVLNELNRNPFPYKLAVIGGLTGSGKTEILHALKLKGEQILDLEALANHRGSSFGLKPGTTQPTTEHFENAIVSVLKSYDSTRPIWMEDESRMIGSCKIPDQLFASKQLSNLFMIQCPLEERIKRLHYDYCSLSASSLIDSTSKISRRLGGLRYQEVISHILGGNLNEAISIVLNYYDKAYLHAISRKKNSFIQFPVKGMSPLSIADRLIMETNLLTS